MIELRPRIELIGIIQLSACEGDHMMAWCSKDLSVSPSAGSAYNQIEVNTKGQRKPPKRSNDKTTSARMK